MKKFFFSIWARKVNAIGIWLRYDVIVESEDQDSAQLKLYQEYDHISVLGVHEMTDAETSKLALPRNL